MNSLSGTRGRLLPILGALVLGWSVLAAVSSLRSAIELQRDPMADLDAEFRAFVPYLPPTGEIGYLEPFDGWTPDKTRTHYAAQYSLAPRLVLPRVEQRFTFVIVARDAARPGDEPRLTGFAPVATFPNGHRLFRRFP